MLNFREELNQRREAKIIKNKGESFLEDFLGAFEGYPDFLAITCLSFFAEGKYLFVRETGVNADIIRIKYEKEEETKEIFAYIEDKLVCEGFKFGPQQSENYFEISL